MIRRGEIYWVQLDPAIGSEIKKTRPALVVSNDANNQAGSLVTVLPITSNLQAVHPFEVLLPAGAGGLKTASKAKASQIRTVDKRRLSASPLGERVDTPTMEQMANAVKIHLDIVE